MKPEEDPGDYLQTLWRNQPIEGKSEMSVEQVKAKSSKFERTIRRRDALEYVAVGIVVLSFGARALAPSTAVHERVASALTVAAAVLVAIRLHRGSGNPASVPVGESTAAYVELYRAQLARQHNLLARAGRWYVAPMVPGLAIFVIGHAIEAWSRGRGMGLIAIEALVVAVVLGGVVLFNHAAARKLQREMDTLSA